MTDTTDLISRDACHRTINDLWERAKATEARQAERTIKALCAALEEEKAENARLRAELTYATQHDTQDELTPLIYEDQKSPGYWGMYGTAIEYVSNRKSKSALVHLVTYLLRRKEGA